MALDHSLVEGDIQPVCGGLSVPGALVDKQKDVVIREQRIGFHRLLDILLGVEQLRLYCHARYVVLEIVCDCSFSLRAFFGGDEYNAVTCLRTVDGGGSSVLQDLHALDAVRINGADILHQKAVHDIKRVGGSVRSDTADADRRHCARLGGSGDQGHARGLTLESLLHMCNRTALDIFSADRGDCSG